MVQHSTSGIRVSSAPRLGLRERVRYQLIRWSRWVPWCILSLTAELFSRVPFRWMIPARVAPTIASVQRRILGKVARRELDSNTASLAIKCSCRNRLLQPLLVARAARLGRGKGLPAMQVNGLGAVLECVSAGQPIILLGSHFGVGRFFPVWFAAHSGLSVLSLEAVNESARMGVVLPELQVFELDYSVFPALATLAAMRHLQVGGVVHLTGDNSSARLQNMHVLSIGGKERRYPAGAGYLACAAKAVVFPYFCRLAAWNQVIVDITAPIQPPRANDTDKHSGEVAVTCAYAERLAEMELNFPGEHQHT